MNSTEPTAPLAFDLERFKQQLAETIAWCAPRATGRDVEHALRSSVSAPPDTSYYLKGKEKEEESARQLRRTQGYESFFAARAQRLHDDHIPVLPVSQDMAGGKLLVFYSELCLYEGAMNPETNGFFDGGEYDESPAWDTWVYYEPVKDHLICWIPPELIGTVKAGLRVMSVDWNWWLTGKEDDDYARVLKNEEFSLYVAPPPPDEEGIPLWRLLNRKKDHTP